MSNLWKRFPLLKGANLWKRVPLLKGANQWKMSPSSKEGLGEVFLSLIHNFYL